MIWKIQQAKQDDAVRAALLHALLRRIYPGNRAENVHMAKNFQPAYRDPSWKK